MSAIEILAVAAIIVWIIYQQVAGQLVQARRLLVLPAVLTVIGLVDLTHARHLDHADYSWLAAGAAGSLAIGLAFGAVTRLSSRDGVLWAKLPVWGLLLWVGLIAWRGLVMLIAARTGAHVAASTTPLLFTLGLNRLGQGAVIAARAAAAGIPFAPDQGRRTRRASALRDRSGRY